MKNDNELIWQRLGKELKLLDRLMGAILCDPEYCAIVDKQTRRNLWAAISRIAKFRSDCEERMFRKCPALGTDVFYGNSAPEFDAVLSELRKELLK